MKNFCFKFQVLVFFVCSLILSSCSNQKKADNKNEIEAFEKYDKIRLLSYSKHRKEYERLKLITISKDSIIIPSVEIVDNVILNKYQREKILNILTTKDIEICTLADCYQPRHILLFYKKNKIIDFYEFCCACGGSRQSEGIKISGICTEQGLELIKIFKEMKLKNDGEEGENYKYF